MGHDGAIRRNYGDLINPLEAGLVLKRSIRKAVDNLAGPEFVMIESYDFAKQRVNVRLKNRPEVGTIFNVPIIGAGGDLKHYHGFRTIKEDGEMLASVGFLIYFRTDSSMSLDKRGFTPPRTPLYWTGEHPVFVPFEAVMLNEVTAEPSVKDIAATSTMPDKLGPGDSALVHSTGSHIIFKENGDVVIKATGNVYIGGANQTAASMQGAARTGDGVNDTTDEISGGSSRVKIG